MVSEMAEGQDNVSCKMLDKKNVEETIKKLHSISVSTEYQSEGEDFDRSQSIEEGGEDNQFREDGDGDLRKNADYLSDYSEFLKNLESKAKNLESGCNMCSSLNTIFSDLCNAEKQYVESLLILKDKVDLKCFTDSEPNARVLSAFRSYLNRMAENHYEFLDSISNVCFLENRSQALQNTSRQIETLKKQLDHYKYDRVYYLGKMKESYFKAKNAVSLCLDATHQAPSIKTSVHKTVIPVIINFINVNNAFYKKEGFHHFIEFNKKLEEISKALSEMESKGLSEVNELISKFMVYEASKIRNLEYDLNSLIETLNSLEDFEESREHCLKNEKLKQIKVNSTRYLEFGRRESGTVPKNLFPYTSIQPPPYRVISKIEENMGRFLNSLWGSEEPLTLEEFNEEIQSSLVRQVFCDLLSKNSSSHSELESMPKLESLAEMVKSVLLVSERQADYWCGYSIIKFSDKYCCTVEESANERCYLWSKICAHEYWKSSAFWEECLTIVLSLDLKALFETSTCLDGNIDQINFSPSTEDPYSFVKWMLRYGLTQVECEDLVHRVCRRLRVPETYIHSLFQRNSADS